MKRLKRHAPELLCGAVLAAFVVKMVVFIAVEGASPLGQADYGSEANSSAGARAFVEKGFLRSSGLPEYGRFNLDSPSKPILRSEFYAHYFPGPDYVMGVVYAVFGYSAAAFQWARLIPLLHVVLAAALFLWAADRTAWKGNRWIKAGVALFLLFPPALRPWAVSLHGHAYTSSYILIGLALGMLAAAGPVRLAGLACAAFAIGFLSNYMLLTAAFVVCAAPLVGSLLAPVSDPRRHRLALSLSLAVGIGLVAAFAVHFLQIAHQFSARDAWLDQIGTLLVRHDRMTNEPSRIQLLGRYSNHAYTFFGVSSVAMALLGCFCGWLHPGPRRYRASLALAVLAAGVASYAWILVMKNHSLGHGHVNPRIFYLMYAAFLCVLGATGSATRRGPPPAARSERGRASS